MADCAFCGKPLNPNDPTLWRKVTVWVYGPKRNGACLMDTQPLALGHDGCGRLARMGVSVEQLTLWETTP